MFREYLALIEASHFFGPDKGFSLKGSEFREGFTLLTFHMDPNRLDTEYKSSTPKGITELTLKFDVNLVRF